MMSKPTKTNKGIGGNVQTMIGHMPKFNYITVAFGLIISLLQLSAPPLIFCHRSKPEPVNKSSDKVIYYDRIFQDKLSSKPTTSANRFDYVSPTISESVSEVSKSVANSNFMEPLLESSLYPRPTETRSVSSLNGVYDFCLTEQKSAMQTDWHTRALRDACSKEDLFRMPVPSAYNDITPLKRVRDHIGWVWYERDIVCPQTGRSSPETENSFDNSGGNSVHLLRFDSVNYETIVWLNGIKLGTHIGGHLPFSFRLTNRDLCDTLKQDNGKRKTNRLTIAVNNNLTANTIPSGQLKQIKLSNGKLVNRFRPDFDFFNYAGILRDVRLYTVPDMFISDITTYVKNVIYVEQDKKEEEGDFGKLFGTANRSTSSRTSVDIPVRAIVGYKLKVDVPDRVLSWMKSVSDSAGTRDIDRTNNFSIIVSLRDDRSEVVARTVKTFNISHVMNSQNELPRYNRRYFELEGDIEINRPKLWLPYQLANQMNSVKATSTSHCDTTCTTNESNEQEQSDSDRLNYRAHLYDIEFIIKLSDNHTNHATRDMYNLKIGIKTVELSTENGPFVINKRPLYLKGFGKHEEQLFRGRSMDLASLMKDIYLIKWTGANVIRTSHYPYSEEFLDEMDAHGLMVIDECPAVGLNYFDDKKLSLHQNIMTELIQRDKNRASVIMWSLANEPRSDMKESNKYFKNLVDYVNKVQSPIKLPLTGAIAQEYNTDHLGQYLDVLMINRYYGWYEDVGHTDQIYDKLTGDLHNWIKKFQRPVMISEYGADCVSGLHKLPDIIFSEEFQTELMKENFRAFDFFRNINDTRLGNYFIGEMIWNFADFQTHQALNRVGGNKKGVFTQDRQPKMAAHLIRSRYLLLDK